MSALRNLLKEIRAYDSKWFDEIGGTLALAELSELENASKRIDATVIVDVIEFINDYATHMAGCENRFSRDCKCGYYKEKSKMLARLRGDK